MYQTILTRDENPFPPPSTLDVYQGRSQDFPVGGGGGEVIFFTEKCSLLVDRLGHTSECCIEVQQKGGTRPPGSPPLAMPLYMLLNFPNGIYIHQFFF